MLHKIKKWWNRKEIRRLKEREERIASCAHKKRLRTILNHEEEEVECLDCGLIKVIPRHA